jgi:hypothetical protein
MTTIHAPQQPTEAVPTRGHDRRWTLGVAGAAVVVVTVLAVILLVGYVPLPVFPQLADDPDPRILGTVAYVHDVGEARCIALVPAGGGTATDLICRPGLEVSEIAWTEDGLVAFTTYVHEGLFLALIDPETGSEVNRMPLRDPLGEGAWTADRARRDDGARLLYEQRMGGEAVVRVRQPDGEIRELVRVEGPADYGIVHAQWSPDGEWILATDTRGRMFITTGTGDPAPRILVEGVGFPAAAWAIEGEATYTVDVEVFAEP